MLKVRLSLGSNVEAKKNICFAIGCLKKILDSVELSPIYESEAVGFDGDNFINLVVEAKTDMPLQELFIQLRAIENEAGRDRTKPRFSNRVLDIDILTYADYVGDFDGIELPRDEILKNAFVLLPLSELAAEDKHPVLKCSYRSLWQDYDKQKQKLWRTSL